MQQMIDEKVFEPIQESNGQPIIRSLLRITEKKTTQGELIKLKARLVANGSTQEEQLWEDKSSPTLKSTNLMAEMNTDVFMLLNPEMAQYYVQLNPSAQFFLKPNGMIVRLKKALNGCQQSGTLWSIEISLRRRQKSALDVPLDSPDDRERWKWREDQRRG